MDRLPIATSRLKKADNASLTVIEGPSVGLVTTDIEKPIKNAAPVQAHEWRAIVAVAQLADGVGRGPPTLC